MATDIQNVPQRATLSLLSGQASVIRLSDAGTNTAPETLTVQHVTTGTAAAGFGVSESIDLQSGAGTLRRVATDAISLTTATDAAEAAKRVISLMLAGTLATAQDIRPGQTLFPAGSAAAPGVSFQGFAATGLTANGGTGLSVVWEGNVGIQMGAGTIGFLSAAAVTRQTGTTATITNSVTVGGTTNTIADFADLTTYSNSAAAIRNDIYQLARALKLVVDALRAYGLIT